jgi:biopolymer transport protein ExbD
MLLLMAALMVAIVWLVSHANERTLPPIELPSSEQARLGSAASLAAQVTLRPDSAGALEVFVEDERVTGDLDGLEAALRERAAVEVTLRADAGTRWEQVLRAMTVATRLELDVSVAADTP